MPARLLKLKEKNDFFLVFRQGQVRNNEFLSVRFHKNGQKNNRFGVLAPVKFFRRANQRNRLKRKLRVILRHFADDFLPGQDVILVARPSLDGIGQEALTAARDLFQKAGLTK